MCRASDPAVGLAADRDRPAGPRPRDKGDRQHRRTSPGRPRRGTHPVQAASTTLRHRAAHRCRLRGSTQERQRRTARLVADAVETLVGRRLAAAPPHQGLRPAGLRRARAPAAGRDRSGTRLTARSGRSRPGPLEEIEQLAGPPEYAYRSIWHSLTGMGDFGRYILRQPSTISKAPTPERCCTKPSARSSTGSSTWAGHPSGSGKSTAGDRWRDDNPVERVGKKYQWIGFYEVLGRITDNYDLSARPGTTHRSASYQYPEQLIWRDIDPTVLARSSAIPRRPRGPGSPRPRRTSRKESPPTTPMTWPASPTPWT